MSGIFGGGKKDDWYEGLKNAYVPEWEQKTAANLVELDSFGEGEEKHGIFFDRKKKGFLVTLNPTFETHKDGWETVSVLVAEQSESFDSAKEAFARWLELLG